MKLKLIFFLCLVLHSNDQCLPDCVTQNMLSTPSLDQIFSLASQLSTPQLFLTDITWISFWVCCASFSFVFPKDSLQKSLSSLCHLLYLPFLFPTSNFLFLIIQSRSDSQSTQFCFSGTKIPLVTKQVYRSRFHSILVYFEVEERLYRTWIKFKKNHRH